MELPASFLSTDTHPEVHLRLSGRQHTRIEDHIFPGDDREAVCLLLCGRRRGAVRQVLTAHEVVPIPYDECTERTADRVQWPTTLLLPHLKKAARQGLSVVKVHSHPSGYPRFSKCDDEADGDLFPSIFGWTDGNGPHASAVMLPSGRIFGRAAWPEGMFTPLARVTVAGDEVHFWDGSGPDAGEERVPAFAERHAQAFGKGTTRRLSKLRVGVVGCSGTGSPVVEQLARLGAGHLVLVDPDHVEERNLNRVLNATCADLGRPKTDVLAEAVRAMGLGTTVEPLAEDLFDPKVALRVASCDVIFGCMDAVAGRDLLNRIASYYLIPYFDVGVRLDADGEGGVDGITGSVNYLQPDGSSLLSREVYTGEQLAAASLRRSDPEEYERQREENYVLGVEEDRPAVVSVNMLYASLAVNEFLARLHPFRTDPNAKFAQNMMSLSQSRFVTSEDGEPCEALAPKAGRGDTMPLLGMPALSRSQEVEVN